MQNLLQMINDLPPLPVTETEINFFNDILRNRFNMTEDEFVSAIASEIQKENSDVAHVNKDTFLNYLKKWFELGCAIVCWKNVLANQWEEQYPGVKFDDNKFMLWLFSSLPSNKEKLTELHSKLKEIMLINSGTECDFIFVTFCTPIQLLLNNERDTLTKHIDPLTKSMFDINDFKKCLREREGPGIKETRIKIAKDFRDKVAVKDKYAYHHYFIGVNDYPKALDRLISDLNEESEFLAADDNDTAVMINDPELINLINTYNAIDFSVGLEKAATNYQKYVEASINAANKVIQTTASYASYLKVSTYSFSSIWAKPQEPQEPKELRELRELQERPKQEPLLQFYDSDMNDTQLIESIKLRNSN